LIFHDEIADGLQTELKSLLRYAHSKIDPLGPERFTKPIHIEWAKSNEEFGKRARVPPEHTTAAADALQQRIIINGPAFLDSSLSERQKTMTHEYVHLFLGAYCEQQPPLWLEEGLAMHLSGDMGFAASNWRLTLANTFGGLLDLKDLRHSFPNAPEPRSMAYRQSYSVTAFVISTRFPMLGASGLTELLTDPVRGPPLLDLYGNKAYSDDIDRNWRPTLGSMWSWLGVFTDMTVVWGLISALFIAAYLIRRRRSRKIVEQWQEEDAWMESLPEEDWHEDP
jgi:hypothetical protein